MAEDRLTIDTRSIADDSDGRRVEIDAEISGERYSFAVLYDVLEALAAVAPDQEVVPLFKAHSDTIARLGTRALARDFDQAVVVISENDLD